jgi:hypothetical protein
VSDESISSFKATNKLLEGTTNADARYSNINRASRDLINDHRVNVNPVTVNLDVAIFTEEAASRASSRECQGECQGEPIENANIYDAVVYAVIVICCAAIMHALPAVLK